MNSKTQKSLKSFIDNFTNSLILTKPLLSIITTDFTAFHSLENIQKLSAQNLSQQTIHSCAKNILNIMKQIDSQQQNLYSEFNQRKTKQSLVKNKYKKKNQIINLNIQIADKLQACNNENINLSNIHSLSFSANNNSSCQISPQLRQIIRPQYRRTINKLQKFTPKEQYQQLEDYENLPILKRKQKFQLRSHQKSDRSVSPKVQGKQRLKSQLTNISTISRGLQTNSDGSFEIDLNMMGIVARTNIQSPHSNKKNNTTKTQRVLQDVTDEEEGILEQQPWECEEDEIEEQIRQLNERLSHRGNKGESMNRAFETQKIFIENEKVTPLYENKSRHKETKTVRLSLTPPKISPYKSRTKSPKPEKAKRSTTKCITEGNEKHRMINVAVKGYNK